jgi:hypothetical protein
MRMSTVLSHSPKLVFLAKRNTNLTIIYLLLYKKGTSKRRSTVLSHPSQLVFLAKRNTNFTIIYVNLLPNSNYLSINVLC